MLYILLILRLRWFYTFHLKLGRRRVDGFEAFGSLLLLRMRRPGIDRAAVLFICHGNRSIKRKVGDDMNIVAEKTRITFSDFTDLEEKQIDDLVATMDKVFHYKDLEFGRIHLPSGMFDRVKKRFPKFPIQDLRHTYWDYDHIQPVDITIGPRSQGQIDAIDFVMKNAKTQEKQGFILPPGYGKTFLGCYCSLKLGLRTLMIAPTTSIKNQWGETLTGMFKVPEDRVLLTRSPKDFVNVKHDFVITTQSSLGSLASKYDLERIMKLNKFGIKIIDEAQMFFHNTIKVDGSANIAHNWYLTGTFGRSSEDEHRIFISMYGNIKIFDVPDKKPTLFDKKPGNIYGERPHMNVKMIWGSSGLSPDEIKDVSSNWKYSERSDKWTRIGISIPKWSNYVIPPDGRITKFLKLILNVIKEADTQVKYGRMLVLVPTIASTEVMKKILQQIYPNYKIGTIHSHVPMKERERVKAEADIMISTVQSAGTGFDAKDLSKLIVATQYKSWILADQVSGRLRRRPDGKETYMWDIVDADIKQLRAWANARASVLKRKSKSFKVV